METDFIDNSSVVTIYKNALIQGNNLYKRDSSSLEDQLDTSNED